MNKRHTRRNVHLSRLNHAVLYQRILINFNFMTEFDPIVWPQPNPVRLCGFTRESIQHGDALITLQLDYKRNLYRNDALIRCYSALTNLYHDMRTDTNFRVVWLESQSKKRLLRTWYRLCKDLICVAGQLKKKFKKIQVIFFKCMNNNVWIPKSKVVKVDSRHSLQCFIHSHSSFELVR